MDLSDEDDNPYDFVAQYKKLQMERKNKAAQTSANYELQPTANGTITSQTSVDVTSSSSTNLQQTQSTAKTDSDATASTSGQTNDRRGSRTKRGRRNCETDESAVVGPVICIGDFYDGYDMPLPKVSRAKSSIDKMMEDVDSMMENWKKRQIEAAEDEDALAIANRVMNVKVFWRQERTYRFPLRMFQPISSIYEHFAKLEDIKPEHVRLDLHKKTLSPTDTPNSINYKIVDFIDGEIEFYRSPYDTPDVVPEIEEPQDTVVKFCIKQKNVKKPIFMDFKKSDKMLILYIKLSEMLGFDIDSFTLEFDGDKVKKSDTMESLDLEGDECFELFQKTTKN